MKPVTRVGLLRAVGAATACYGVAVAAWPQLLAKPSGLVTEDGRTPQDTRTALRPLAWRDAACGAALMLAPEGPALTTAAWLRAAADLGDAALLGATLPRKARAKAVAVSVGWGALSVAALCAGRTRSPGEGAGPRLRS
ncbi:hypothetical protein [Streptomyces sp. 891-h]|uniref:hypothetical protein n=1 Tax=unclassified Streptomyces TaxID=2593676 RepID=UPI001FA94910|nr:hypothetical protein [Streptomyces sp. 891-h]